MKTSNAEEVTIEYTYARAECTYIFIDDNSRLYVHAEMLLFQPFFLILCKHKILPQDLLFSVESAHHNSNKEVEDQEIA
jgi:hypothetical protein